jgi:hypothetical protein
MNKEFLAGLSFRSEEIELEGHKFKVVEMNASTAEKYESSLYKIVNNSVKYDASKAKTKLVLLTLCDENGKRIYNDNDYGLVENLPSHIVNEIFNVASGLNNLDVEETEKN